MRLGGSSSSGGGGADAKPVKLKVGVIPIADVAPLYVGIQQGFFEQEKLDIEPQLQEGGATITAAVVSGDLQIGFSNATSVIIAASKKLPVRILAQGVQAARTEKDAWDAVLVPRGSPIRSPADLEGKTVSVNNLNNVGPLTINNAMEKAGADPSKVKYTEVPFPDAVGALKAGRVDAAWVVEPFASQGTGEGDRQVLHPFEDAAPGYTVATWFTGTQYAEKNPDVGDRFVRAIDKSNRYAQTHPESVRAAVPTYTKIPEPVAAKMKLPQWSPDLNRPSIQLTVDLSAKYGYLDEKPDLDELIRPSG